MDDVQAMRRTIAIARESHHRGDLPYASIVMRGDEVLAEGWNEVLTSMDNPTVAVRFFVTKPEIGDAEQDAAK